MQDGATRRRSRHWLLEWVVFVCIMTAVTDVYYYALRDILRKLLDDPARYFFAPMTVIAMAGFALLYPLLGASRRWGSRVVTLYLGFVAIHAAYGAYLWTKAAYGTWRLILVAIVAGHLYGVPLFLLTVLTDLLLTRLLFAKLERR